MWLDNYISIFSSLGASLHSWPAPRKRGSPKCPFHRRFSSSLHSSCNISNKPPPSCCPVWDQLGRIAQNTLIEKITNIWDEHRIALQAPGVREFPVVRLKQGVPGAPRACRGSQSCPRAPSPSAPQGRNASHPGSHKICLYPVASAKTRRWLQKRAKPGGGFTKEQVRVSA